jgi:hypothetical protein
MIKFSANDEQFLDTILTPPATPPISDEEVDEKDKSLWFDDKSTPDPAISIDLSRPHGNLCFLAGESMEVDVRCTVRQLQLLSGFLEGFCVTNGKCEETFCFQEVLLFPHQQYQGSPFVETESKERNGKNCNNTSERTFKFWLTIPITAPPSVKVNPSTGVFYRVRVCGIGGIVLTLLLPFPLSGN